MGADLTDVLGTDRAVNDRHDARRVIEAALDRYDGPCSQAYADVLSAYVAATDWGRANLFLEVAYRALGQPNPSAVAVGADDGPSVADRPDARPVTVGSAFRSLSAALLPNGVRVTGVETFEACLDRVITATRGATGFSVLLNVEGQESPLPPDGARSLAAALIAAAQQVDGGAA